MQNLPNAKIIINNTSDLSYCLPRRPIKNNFTNNKAVPWLFHGLRHLNASCHHLCDKQLKIKICQIKSHTQDHQNKSKRLKSLSIKFHEKFLLSNNGKATAAMRKPKHHTIRYVQPKAHSTAVHTTRHIAEYSNVASFPELSPSAWPRPQKTLDNCTPHETARTTTHSRDSR